MRFYCKKCNQEFDETEYMFMQRVLKIDEWLMYKKTEWCPECFMRSRKTDKTRLATTIHV